MCVSAIYVNMQLTFGANEREKIDRQNAETVCLTANSSVSELEYIVKHMQILVQHTTRLAWIILFRLRHFTKPSSQYNQNCALCMHTCMRVFDSLMLCVVSMCINANRKCLFVCHISLYKWALVCVSDIHDRFYHRHHLHMHLWTLPSLKTYIIPNFIAIRTKKVLNILHIYLLSV